jgi:acyl-CoA dehydrogenase
MTGSVIVVEVASRERPVIATRTGGNGAAIARRVEAFVREIVIPYERSAMHDAHGPTDEIETELRMKARDAGVLTPHILADGGHLNQQETAMAL